MHLLLEIIFIWAAFSFGLLCGVFLHRIKGKHKYNGIINVIRTPDKTTYSIELNHPTEVLQTIEEATFKIQLPEEDPVAQ